MPFLEAVLGTKQRLHLADGKTLDVQLPPGTDTGQTLRLKGQGLPGRGGAPAGDAFVEMTVEPHPVFTRDGNDILVELPITLYEAVLGATHQRADHRRQGLAQGAGRLQQRHAAAPARQGVQAGKSGERGDQYVRLVVVLPKEVDPGLEGRDREIRRRTHPYKVRGKLGTDLDPWPSPSRRSMRRCSRCSSSSSACASSAMPPHGARQPGRWRRRRSCGAGAACMRNFAEYVPLALILMALAELQGQPGWIIHLIGALLAVGRLAHAYGVSQAPQILKLRVLGMVADHRRHRSTGAIANLAAALAG